MSDIEIIKRKLQQADEELRQINRDKYIDKSITLYDVRQKEQSYDFWKEQLKRMNK